MKNMGIHTTCKDLLDVALLILHCKWYINSVHSILGLKAQKRVKHGKKPTNSVLCGPDGLSSFSYIYSLMRATLQIQIIPTSQSQPVSIEVGGDDRVMCWQIFCTVFAAVAPLAW